jgi:hypothetical protein
MSIGLLQQTPHAENSDDLPRRIGRPHEKLPTLWGWAVTSNEAARVLLQCPEDIAARRALLGALVNAIDRGVARAVRNPTRDNDRTEIANAFIDSKLLDRTFLRGVADADSAEAFTARSAQNFAVSKLRGAQGIRSRSERIDTHAVQILAEDQSDPFDQGIDDENSAIRDSAAAKRFEELPSEDKLLFYLVHDVPPRWVVEQLAKKRGVATALLEFEIAQRTASHNDEADKLRNELERRSHEIERLRHRLALSRRARLSQESSENELRLIERLDALQELQVDTRRRLRDPEARSKRWDELLVLLGDLPADAVERKRAVNRITVRYKRLVARIRGDKE